MNIQIDLLEGISQIDQFASQLGVAVVDRTIALPDDYGKGKVRYFDLGSGLELHHYEFCLQKKLTVQSQSPLDKGLYVFQISLSPNVLEKEIGGQSVKISRSLPSGMLFYSPGNSSVGGSPLGIEFEVLFISFPRRFLEKFSEASHPLLVGEKPFCIFEELSPFQENSLREILKLDAQNLGSLFRLQGTILSFIGEIFTQLEKRDASDRSSFTPMELEPLFKVREILRAHIFSQAPTLSELSQQVGFSGTKLKTQFKAFFGKPIYQYYLEMKMETAGEMLQEKGISISELGYRLGYSNISQFIRAFKKHFGYTPKAYRENL